MKGSSHTANPANAGTIRQIAGFLYVVSARKIFYLFLEIALDIRAAAGFILSALVNGDAQSDKERS